MGESSPDLTLSSARGLCKKKSIHSIPFRIAFLIYIFLLFFHMFALLLRMGKVRRVAEGLRCPFGLVFGLVFWFLFSVFFLLRVE